MLVKLNRVVTDIIGHNLHGHLVGMALEELGLRQRQLEASHIVGIPWSLPKVSIDIDQAAGGLSPSRFGQP
jgi:hypothetical protein